MSELQKCRLCGGGELVEAWYPIETAPKKGEYLVFVWEGSWDNPKKRFRIYHATGYPTGPSWARNYRTEEGEVYRASFWKPIGDVFESAN